MKVTEWNSATNNLVTKRLWLCSSTDSTSEEEDELDPTCVVKAVLLEDALEGTLAPVPCTTNHVLHQGATVAVVLVI
jgi:hypothetical protein